MLIFTQDTLYGIFLLDHAYNMYLTYNTLGCGIRNVTLPYYYPLFFQIHYHSSVLLRWYDETVFSIIESYMMLVNYHVDILILSNLFDVLFDINEFHANLPLLKYFIKHSKLKISFFTNKVCNVKFITFVVDVI